MEETNKKIKNNLEYKLLGMQREIELMNFLEFPRLTTQQAKRQITLPHFLEGCRIRFLKINKPFLKRHMRF